MSASDAVKTPPKKKIIALPVTASGALDTRAIVEQNEGLVRSIAYKIMRKMAPTVEVDDLLSYGHLGLLEAAQRFNPESGAQFSSYAYYRIQGAIYDGLRQSGWLKRSEYAKYRAERGANDLLQQQQAQAQGTLGADKRSLNEQVKGSADTIASLVTIFVTSMEAVEGQQFADTSGVPADELVEKRQMAGKVRGLIEGMGDEDRRILEGFYFTGKSLKELGEDVGLSKSWMSRKHAQAIKKLRVEMEKFLGEATLTLKTR